MAQLLKISSKGQGIPLVFIHGWGLNAGVWQPTMDVLSENYKVITVDLPGFGTNKSHEITPYSIDAVTREISHVIARPSVVIGWSLGGLIANKLALDYPKKVKGVVSVASSLFFMESDDWAGIRPEVLALFHRQLSQDTRKTIDNFLKIQAMGSPHIRQDIKQIRQLIMQFDIPNQQTLDESLSLLETVDLRERMHDISIPYLRIYGKLDSLVPVRVAKQIEKIHPKSDTLIFSDASHAPFISHFDHFITELRSWLIKQFS